MRQKNFSLIKSFKALSDQNRLKILCLIYKNKNICVSDIAEKLSISVAIASFHLHSLSRVGLVSPKRNGKKICYLLCRDSFAKDLKKLICKYK